RLAEHESRPGRFVSPLRLRTRQQSLPGSSSRLFIRQRRVVPRNEPFKVICKFAGKTLNHLHGDRRRVGGLRCFLGSWWIIRMRFFPALLRFNELCEPMALTFVLTANSADLHLRRFGLPQSFAQVSELSFHRLRDIPARCVRLYRPSPCSTYVH